MKFETYLNIFETELNVQEANLNVYYWFEYSCVLWIMYEN